MSETVEEARTKLSTLRNLHENVFLESKEEKAGAIADQIREIERLLKPLEQDKKFAKDVGALLGLTYNCTPEYSSSAESLLSKAVKQDPTYCDGWTALGECLWKKGEKDSAKSCFLESVKQQPTVEALLELSILVRQLGGTDQAADIEQSIAYARRAMEIDIRSHKAWYVLGNALCAKYFLTRSSQHLKQAFAAYKRAEALGGEANPDLFFNRGSIQAFLLNQVEATQDFERAQAIDKSLTAQVRAALDELSGLANRFKRLMTLQMFANAEDIAKSRLDLERSPLSAGAVGFEALAAGANNGMLFAAKVVAKEALPKDAPRIPPFHLLCVDARGVYGLVSLFDIGADTSAFTAGRTIAVADPEVAVVDVTNAVVGATASSEPRAATTCIAVKMTQREKMRINGVEVASISSQDGVLVSETFA